MSIEQIQYLILANPYIAFAVTISAFILVYLIIRWIISRGLTYIASRTKNKYDDILVAELHPFEPHGWLRLLFYIRSRI